MKATHTLRAVPKAWSYTFSVKDGTDSVAEVVDVSWWGEKGELKVQGETYSACYEKPAYILESAAGVLARAEHLKWLSRELAIEYAGQRYILRGKALHREFLLLEGDTQIGSIAAEGFLTRKVAVELPKELPLFLQVFIIWLAMTVWKQDEASGLA